jgi:hypothetical protein
MRSKEVQPSNRVRAELKTGVPTESSFPGRWFHPSKESLLNSAANQQSVHDHHHRTVQPNVAHF